MDAELVIVGGGPAATHVLTALAESHGFPRAGAPSRVVVIERTDRFGPGLPYGEAADPEHTYGRIPRRRRDKGAALSAAFERAVDRLEDRGVTVVLQRETYATALERDLNAWRVCTDRGEVRAPRAVLATGNHHVDKLVHIRRSVDWRWDVRVLHASVSDRDDVIVLGSSQSAVDIALTLGARRRLSDRSACGRVVLASRRGLLPSVWGPLRGSRVPPGGGQKLDALRRRPEVRLSEVFDALRCDVKNLGATLCEDPEGALWERPRDDGAARLRADLDAALAAIHSGREIPWQSVLWPTVPLVFDVFPRLVAEDRIALAPRWTGFLRYLEAIHVGAASRVLDLMDEGFVETLALGETVTVTEDPQGVLAQGPWSEVRGHRIVDARGHDPSIKLSNDPFLRSVLAGGHALAARVPFLSAPPSVDASLEVVDHGGSPHLVTGGLWVDPATFRVRAAAGSSSGLYALGPLTQGQFPVYLGLWALRTAAARIVDDLARP